MDKFVGKLGRQDSEYDNTLAEHAEYTPPRPRILSWWKVTLLILALIPWSLIAAAVAAAHAHYHFLLHAH